MRCGSWAARRIVFQRTCEGPGWRSFHYIAWTTIQEQRTTDHGANCRTSGSVRLRPGATVHRKWWTNYRKPGRIGLRARLPEITKEIYPPQYKEAASVGGLFHSGASFRSSHRRATSASERR